jgi:SIR2-like domain
VIRDQTALVLGAGASVPYGFPSGAKLMNDIWTKIKGEVLFRDGLASCGFDRDLVATFADELSHEHRYSLDAFLETHQEFLDVGKAAIALSMVPCEMDTTITPKQKNGWHRYFFNQMLHGGPSRVRSQEAFALNRLSVVTFNFERSFERALFLFLKHTFKSEDDVDALDLVQQIPVFHVHGDLGKPDWVGIHDREFRRAYEPQVSIQVVQKCAERIRLVTDELPSDDPHISAARNCIQNAEKIVFMGFAYDHRNLDRLGILGKKWSELQVWGTCYDLTQGDIGRIQSTFNEITLNPSMAHQYVESLPVLHDQVK